MKILEKFTTKKGRIVEIVEPTMELLDKFLEFSNKLAKEDTFLTFYPAKLYTLEEERKCLSDNIDQVKNGSGLFYWVIFNNQVIGTVDIRRGNSVRNWHVGKVGLMIDQDFRGDGLGKFLMKFILEKAKKAGMKTASLTVFSDNDIAISLYNKLGFKEWGRLPDGLYRKKKFSDAVKMYLELQ